MNLYGFITENFTKLVSGEVGPGKPYDTAVIKSESFKFCPGNRGRRFKKPVPGGKISLWNSPDAEKTEDMIDAPGVVEFGSLVKTIPPPAVVFRAEVLPVVDWKSPVLAVGGAGSEIPVEIIPFGPEIGTVFVNQDGYVAF